MAFVFPSNIGLAKFLAVGSSGLKKTWYCLARRWSDLPSFIRKLKSPSLQSALFKTHNMFFGLLPQIWLL